MKTRASSDDFRGRSVISAQHLRSCRPNIISGRSHLLATSAAAFFFACVSTSSLAQEGFTISYDGKTVAGDAAVRDEADSVDVDAELALADVQVKFDGLDIRPILNVATGDLRRTYQPGETVHFLASANYPDWIASAEVRISVVPDGKSKAVTRKTIIARLPVDGTGKASWEMPAGGGTYEYVLHVQDDEGRFDETVPLTLKSSTAEFDPHEKTAEPVAPGFGEDRTAVRNIPVYGGSVTVYGRSMPAGSKAVVMGREVPVDGEGAFVVQRILPPGDHEVEVALASAGEGVSFNRSINIPTHDFFYVALADLTVGKRFGSAKVVAANKGEYDKVYTKGRLAFYLKGKIQGRYLLTASADTGEDKIQNLIKGLDAKDPRQLLRRIDPDEFYPVYGDDSTMVEDAPTSGKFYVRLERGESNVMWGNFQAQVRGNALIAQERKLYGAQGVYKSEGTTSFGEKRAEASVYAAKPDTLPQRDVFQGTGGSAYFLKRQDISRGSETVTVIESDPDSGRILSRRTLVAGEDYDIDYLQGIIILRKPLASTTRATGAVRDSSIGDNTLTLAVNYEYTPTLTDVKGYSTGGRAQAWLDDHFRVGGVAMNETTGAAHQKMLGADVRVRATDTTFIDADYAETKGPGFGRTLSTDGGLTLVDELTSGVSRKGRAYSLRAQLDLNDLSDTLHGIVGGHYEHKQAGFASLDSNITSTQTDWGVFADLKLAEHFGIKLAHDHFTSKDGRKDVSSSAEATWDVTPEWTFVAGVKHTDLDTPTADVPQHGPRVDVGGKIEWHPDDTFKTYVFGQATVKKSSGVRRNNRYGAGFEMQVSEKTDLEVELSHGTTGIGGLAAINYHPTPDDKYYFGYKLEADRDEGTAGAGRDLGGIVLGMRRKYNDWLAAYGENTYDMFGKKRSLTSTYGVEYTPDAAWTVSGGMEIGRIVDANASDFDRIAPSLSVAYRPTENRSVKARVEARYENSDDNTRDRTTYLFSAGYSDKINDEWRLLLNADAVISDSDQASILDGDYLEASAGLAYRPIDNDKWNALFKYSFLYDLPGPDQVAYSTATTLGPAQRSHVLSADVTYEFNQYLTLGAKYGFRIGEVSSTRSSNDFKASAAHLGVLRADIAVAKEWDVLLEGRALYLTDAKETNFGALAAVYRHIGDNMKIGVGYNFGHFSDDLTDLTYDDHGIFFNAIGKF